ncbi:CDP-glycerol glycerophosphotransferase family protein [Brevibacterium permense]|uniref:CDP-glycerol glycerophosphotransferase family protein n=1 Tax=Brevibacterium permense TaxID=234834 RepID=UPI0021D3576E|nr:CDP-glycerol glycerophosphotransferase family protein [Brevibacterium permense]
MHVSETLALASRIARKMRTSANTVRHRTRLRAMPEFRPAPGASVDVLVNFPGEPVNIYQIRQWYGPLEYLARTHRVAILCYQPSTAELVARETDLKVVLTPSYTDLREVEQDLRPKIILYPNQNYANYRILGITSAEHVFISHGESDKIYMASNWVKVFNYFFVAGEASRDRLRKHVRNYDVDARTLAIGRPQIDIRHESPLKAQSDRITVLYAPTWEGGRRTMRYGSVASHGVTIVSRLLSDSRFRVIYRPHPRTGVLDTDFAEADEKIRDLLHDANEANEDAHLIDTSAFGWQLEFADLMITDISAVAYDWLTTAKPLLVTQPTEPEAVMPTEGFIAKTRLLTASDADRCNQIVSNLLDDAMEREKLARWADYYYGDRTKGASLSRFASAIEQVISERDQAVEMRQNPSNSGCPVSANAAPEVGRPPKPAARAAMRGVTFAARSIRFAGNGMANLVAQYQGESKLIDSRDSAMKRRRSEILVSTMAGPQDIGLLLDWLPALELVNRTHSVAILTGNQRTYDRLVRATRLRVHIGRNASETEEMFVELAPRLHLQFEQANLNLRELTHRNLRHVYVGSDEHCDWINNRLRAFDTVLFNGPTSVDTIASTLINLPSTTALTVIEDQELDGQGHRARSRSASILATLNESISNAPETRKSVM